MADSNRLISSRLMSDQLTKPTLARLGIKLQNYESCHLIVTLNWFIQYTHMYLYNEMKFSLNSHIYFYTCLGTTLFVNSIYTNKPILPNLLENAFLKDKCFRLYINPYKVQMFWEDHKNLAHLSLFIGNYILKSIKY